MPRIPHESTSVPSPPEVRVSPDAEMPPREPRPRVLPLSTAWITDDLLHKTRRVWSKAYQRPIDDREATEILMNVKRFAEVLLKAAESESTP